MIELAAESYGTFLVRVEFCVKALTRLHEMLGRCERGDRSTCQPSDTTKNSAEPGLDRRD